MDRVHVSLLVQDGALAEVLQEVLQEHGLGVRISPLRTAPAGRDDVGLVLADLPMKRPAELRALAADLAPTPLGLLTAFKTDADELGAAFALAKPIDIDELLAAVASALRLPEVPASSAQRGLVERYFAALGAHDWRALSELVHPKIVYNLPTDAPHGGIVVGREDFMRYTEGVFGEYPAVEFQIDSQLPLPLSRVASYTGSWTTKAGRVALSGNVVFGFEGDAISRVGVHLDSRRLQALRASN
jgi:hypothetical protein